MTATVQTVLGAVPAGRLGHVQPHEHLVCDLTPGVPALLHTDDERARAGDPVRLGTYYKARTDWSFTAVNRITPEDSLPELRDYAAAGGGTIVDSTTVGIGRDPEALARLSAATGVHVVMGTGFYVRQFHPDGMDALGEDALAERMIAEIRTGVGDTGIRAGVIGEIGLTSPVHPVERTVLRAAVRAQRETGVCLQIHPGRDAGAPLDAMRMVLDAGGAPERTIMSHLDRTLFAPDAFAALAATGCYLELDLFGQESSYYPLADIDMPNDGARVAALRRMCADGHLERLLISQDVCRTTHLRRFGGEGYTHVLERVLPLMRRRGFTDAELRTICVTNPARALAVSPAPTPRR